MRRSLAGPNHPRRRTTTEHSRRRFLATAGSLAAAVAAAGSGGRSVLAEGEEPAVSAPETMPPVTQLPTLPPPGFGYGMQAHLYYQNVPEVLAHITGAEFGWVKQQVRWSHVEPNPGEADWAPLDAVADGAAAAGIRVLFSVVTAPAWSRAVGSDDGPPDDLAVLGDFVTRLATRYAGKVQAYEIWNEQNFSREWGGGRINAGEYVELLKVAYTAIKAADPNATVISGALTPTGFNDPLVAIDDVVYLQRLYAYQGGVFKTVCDAVGAHAGGFNNPPEDTPTRKSVSTTTFKGHPSFYFRRIEQLREIMVLGGDSQKKMWVTEFGWSTANEAKGYEYGKDNTELDQANYLARAFAMAHEYGWVEGMFVWNLNFQQVVTRTDEKFPFGIIRPDGSPRPAYLVLKGMPKLP